MEVQGDWAYTGESISRENHIQPKRMYAKAGEEQMVCPPPGALCIGKGNQKVMKI